MDSESVPYVHRPWADRDYDSARDGRATFGLSLRDVARAVGVSHETIRQWERAREPRRAQRNAYILWLAVYGGKLYA